MFTAEFLQAFVLMVSLPSAIILYRKDVQETALNEARRLFVYNDTEYVRKRR